MNADEVTISLSITPTWSILKDVREKTEEFMKKKKTTEEIIDSTVMCAVELVENSIKYGSSAKGKNNINFDLTTEGDVVRIKVSNGINDELDVKTVKLHIDRIKASNDPGTLYTERLQQLMENPKPGVSQLGLYRIAYEGEFKLDYTYSHGLLSVIAERKYK
jgi:hypothetical protein